MKGLYIMYSTPMSEIKFSHIRVSKNVRDRIWNKKNKGSQCSVPLNVDHLILYNLIKNFFISLVLKCLVPYYSTTLFSKLKFYSSHISSLISHSSDE